MTSELTGKRLELLKEAVPTASRVVFLSEPEDSPSGLQRAREAAWSAWLSDPTSSADDYHRLEISGLWKVLAELRQLFPTSSALLAAIEWDAKERFLEAKRAEEDRQWQLWRDAIEAHNQTIRRFVEEHGVDGLKCPHCGHSSADIEFVDRVAFNSTSCFVCPACARSFGHDL